MTLARLNLALLTCVLLALSGCDDDDCRPGEPCVCTDMDECYIQCDEPGCVQECHNAVHCGGVCEESCTFECHDMNECSTSCGDNCIANCHQVVSCEAITGANSNYTCSDADRCGVEVGNGTEVLCSNLSSCVVRCHGACTVECDEVGRPCEVYCGSATEPRTCASGTSCGCN
ncbi:MAG TPA: hypothetical protein VGK73_30805 [Polyangiaceae bacterium]